MNEITAIKEGIETAFENAYNEYSVKTFRFFLKRTRLHETAKERELITDGENAIRLNE